MFLLSVLGTCGRYHDLRSLRFQFSKWKTPMEEAFVIRPRRESKKHAMPARSAMLFWFSISLLAWAAVAISAFWLI
jgi:hypothetical protein